ncbi:hypothetical protein [Candidatus Enterococcus clewellii]|uniref:Uncharacterized protein n=1 Tax=Candidatus Enterococcus clewellii TaxID=1834193 RepID=A0A242K5B9_9ENTE|nr:hypothetical protein [Enterococcus sp. 9E7_DIV0242]OTP14344.1 hypothetical protein A5888_002445 [Enterococcus sp. 9E7_DIV0242]
MMRWVFLFFNLLMGFGAGSGSFLALNAGAREAVGINSSMLVHSPFTSFLIPGLFLLLVLSCGNFLVGFLTLKKLPDFPYYQCLVGAILFLWIMIQCVMIWDIVALHVIFFSVGVIQFALGLWTIRKQQVPFPFSAHQN